MEKKTAYISYLAAPWPTLGTVEGTKQMVINAFLFRFLSEGHQKHRNDFGTPILVECPVGFKMEAFQIVHALS